MRTTQILFKLKDWVNDTHRGSITFCEIEQTKIVKSEVLLLWNIYLYATGPHSLQNISSGLCTHIFIVVIISDFLCTDWKKAVSVQNVQKFEFWKVLDLTTE